MNDQEIKEYFKEKAASRRGNLDPETARLIKEIEDFEVEWWDTTTSKFLDGKVGEKFLKDHEDQSPDEVFEILMKQSNIGDLFNKALKKKISEMRGAIVKPSSREEEKKIKELRAARAVREKGL